MAQESIDRKECIVVTGASGYLGHFILHHLYFGVANNGKDTNELPIVATYNKNKPLIKSHNDSSKKIHYVSTNFSDKQSIDNCIASIFDNLKLVPKVIIHCAALSSVVKCEKNEDIANGINCPQHWVDALTIKLKTVNTGSKQPIVPYFIALSTDHVYDGTINSNNNDGASTDDNKESNSNSNIKNTREMYNEECKVNPIDKYGSSKAKFEKYLMDNWDNKKLIILRSSVIYGPSVKQLLLNEIETNENENDGNDSYQIHNTMLQFVIESFEKFKVSSSSDKQDSKNDGIILFKDEKRNFVCVWDVVQVIDYFVKNSNNLKLDQGCIFNLGGAESISRVDFGRIVCQLCKYDDKLIVEMNRKDCKQAWAHSAPSPQDLSMSCAKLAKQTAVNFLTVKEGIFLSLQKQLSLM